MHRATHRSVPASVPPTGPAARARAALAALAVGAVLAVGAPAPAGAHDTLTGSTPADGASVEAAPAAVELSFAQPPLALGSEVQVTGPDGQVVNAGELVLAGTTVSQPLAPGLPAGQYAVVWRVTSADGHPISGELSFTAAGSTAAEPGPTPTQDAGAPSPEPSATVPEPPAASPGTGTQDTAGGDAADDAADAGGGGAVPWVIGAGLVLAAGAAAWWAARRRSAGATGG